MSSYDEKIIQNKIQFEHTIRINKFISQILKREYKNGDFAFYGADCNINALEKEKELIPHIFELLNIEYFKAK